MPWTNKQTIIRNTWWGGWATNLGYTPSATNGIVTSDTGTDATIPLGNGTDAGLSINDYTTAEKNKLSGIATGAEVNVNADWNSASGDSQILNKPTLGTASSRDVAPTGNASSTQVVKGDDTRLSDARTPTAHNQNLSTITDVTMTVANLNSLDDWVNSTLHFHNTDRDRANHTGTQLASTISDLAETIEDTIGAKVVAGTNVTVSYNDTTGETTISSTGWGGGGWSVNSGSFTVDFWTNTTKIYYQTVTVTDANVTWTSKPVISLYNAWSRDADEIEMVDLKCSVSTVWTGTFDVYVTDWAMQAEGSYNFNYILI